MTRPEVMLVLLLVVFTLAYAGLLVWVECVLPRRRRLRRMPARQLSIDELDEFTPASPRGAR